MSLRAGLTPDLAVAVVMDPYRTTVEEDATENRLIQLTELTFRRDG